MTRINISSQALRIFNSCDKKSAISYLENHLKNNYNDGLGYYYLGLCFDIEGDRKSANESFSNGILSSDSKAEKWFIFAKLCLKAGNYKKAMNSIEYSISNDSCFGEPMSLRGDIYKKQKQYEAALSSYEKANQLNASNSNWNYFSMAEIYIIQGKFNQAEKMLNMAIKVCDCFTAAYVLKSKLAALKNDWITHEKCIQEAMRLNPKFVNEFEYIKSEEDRNEYLKKLVKTSLSSKDLLISMKAFNLTKNNKRNGIIIEFND